MSTNTPNANTPAKTPAELHFERMEARLNAEAEAVIQADADKAIEELDKKALNFIKADVESIQNILETAANDGELPDLLSNGSSELEYLMGLVEKALFANKKKMLANTTIKKKTNIRQFVLT